MNKNNDLKCTVLRCNRPYCSTKYKLCPAHLMRLRRKGSVGHGKIRGYSLPKPIETN